MDTLESVRARICAALETPEDDWVAHAERIIAAYVNQTRARKIYDVSTQGGRIRAARELAGLGLGALAKRVSLPVAQLGRVERGEEPLPLQKVPGVAVSLGVSVPWLVAGGPEGGPRTHGSVLRAGPTPRALREAEKARRLAAARAEAAARNKK